MDTLDKQSTSKSMESKGEKLKRFLINILKICRICKKTK